MTFHHDGANGIDRYHCWDEINRLIATSDGNQISHYIYDANGERAMKYTGDISHVQINQYTVIDNAEMNNFTYYVNPLMVVGTQDYTKHYYIEGQRFMSKIGGGMANDLTPLFANNTGIDLDRKWDKIEEQLENSLECLALNGSIAYDGINMDWLYDAESYSNPEEDLYFYHPDHLGSSSFITGATGEPTQHLEYLPFGELFIEERSTWNTPYKFSGKELDDETGYSYFGARYYDPNISIWLSVDPLSDEYPSHSPYTYALNNPIKVIDPDGRSTDWVETTADDGSKEVEYRKDVKSQADLDPNSGDKYLGKTGYGVENDQLTWYGEDGTKSPTMMTLPEVEIDGGEMSDHAKTMSNPLVQKIHGSHYEFWNHPVTKATTNTLFFVATGGIEGLVSLGSAGAGVFSSAKSATGGLKQWIRIGKSYSKSLESEVSRSVRWGASPRYASRIGNPQLRELNQTLRGKKLPGSGWRVADKGHFHLRR